MELSMATNLSTFSSKVKKLPWPLIASLMIFILTQAGLTRSPVFWRYIADNAVLGQNDPLRFEAMLRTIPRSAEFKKVLIIGTSQAREGIDADYLNEQFRHLNVQFYNMGIGGSFHPVDMFMLKERIVGLHPDVVVYTPWFESFYTPYKMQKANHLEYFFNPKVLPYLAKYLWPGHIDEEIKKDLSNVVFSYYSILFRFREHFGPIFLSGIKSSMGLEEKAEPVKYVFTDNSTGFSFEKMLSNWKKEDHFRFGVYSELYKKMFNLFAREMADHHIQLIVLTPPVHPLIEQACSDEIRKSYHAFLIEQSRKQGFEYTPDYSLPHFSPEEFLDFTHLNSSGREKFTRFLVGYFEQQLRISRQVVFNPKQR
jgi:hypothetical protein